MKSKAGGFKVEPVMPNRSIIKPPVVVPQGIEPHCPALLLEDVYHAPGQAAAIRFFDTRSHEDFEAMREIMKGKHVKKWMDYTGTFTKEDYLDWAGTHTNNHFLFAVLDARTSTLSDLSFVRGFVYLYSEREEKFRIKRMQKYGLLKTVNGPQYSLEVSFALRPILPGMHSGSGLISSALRQSCQQVKLLLEAFGPAEVELFAFIDQENIPAQRTVEAAGFVNRGLMRYDPDSDVDSVLYILDWQLLEQKISQRLLEMH